MNELPDIEQCLPHRPPMLLLDRLVEAGVEELVSELTVRADSLFDYGGIVPAHLGLEYMAQTIAAFSGFHALRDGEPVKVGLLLGTRKFQTNVAHFHRGEVLRITVNRTIQGQSGMASFHCSVRGENILQTATLSVYEPPDQSQLLGGTGQ